MPEYVDFTEFAESADLKIMLQQESTERAKSTISMTNRIIGLPFQYLSTTDIHPYKDIDAGRTFLENMIAEAPILSITPGVSNYFNTMTEDQKGSLSAYIDAAMAGQTQTSATLKEVADIEGRYYSLTPTYTWYMSYVNLLCRVCSMYLGIQDNIVPGTDSTYGKFNWAKYTNILTNKSAGKQDSATNGLWDDLKDDMASMASAIADNLIGDAKILKFYVNGAESISKSFTNTTSESKIAGLFDTVESLWKEINLLGGGSFVGDIANTVGSGLGGMTGTASNFLKGDGTNNLSKVIGLTQQAIQGSNIMFPEIWGDSSHKNGYSFSMELSSPYGDPESVFLNILVPMMHILALGLPRQVSANSFTTPFLVQCSMKGRMGIDLGILTNISIDIGGDGTWNVNSLPNKCKITFDISDLYDNLMMTSAIQPFKFLQNDGLITFLATTCAIDILEPHLWLKLKTIYNTITQAPFDMGNQFIHGTVIEGIRNTIMRWVRL